MKTKKRAASRHGASHSATPYGASSAGRKTTSKAAAATVLKLGLPRLGTVWPGQGGRFAGLIIGDDGQPNYAEVAADLKHWPKGAWSPRTRLTGAESEYDGMANTRAMAAAGNEAAKQALAARIDGHNDFYIAARFEERLVQLNRAAPGHTGWAWSSTQDRAYVVCAWAQSFDVGFQGVHFKVYELPFVLVRRVPIR
jgi:hypothetical protein